MPCPPLLQQIVNPSSYGDDCGGTVEQGDDEGDRFAGRLLAFYLFVFHVVGNSPICSSPEPYAFSR